MVLTIDLKSLEMEMDKDDASSPRGIQEVSMRSRDKKSESSKSNTSECEAHSSKTSVPSRWGKFFKIWKRLPSIPPMNVPKRSNRKSLSARENRDGGLHNFKAPWKNFTLSELKTATNNFSSGSNLLKHEPALWLFFFQNKMFKNTHLEIEDFPSLENIQIKVLDAPEAMDLTPTPSLLLYLFLNFLTFLNSFW